MSLVSYSSDSSSSSENSEPEDNNPPQAKRVCHRDTSTSDAPLQIPSGLLKAFGGGSERNDDPEEHGGRQRLFAHVKGNWATFVYVPCPEAFTSWITPALPSVFAYLKKRGETAGMPAARAAAFESNPSDDLHMSVSRVVPVQHHIIKPLTAELQQRCQSFDSFDIMVEKPRIYHNDNKSRSFLSLDVVHGREELKSLLRVVDDVFVDFGLPKFYEEASFHVSVGWTLGEVPFLSAKEQQELLSLLHRDNSSTVPIRVDRLVCKTGNKLHPIHFRS